MAQSRQHKLLDRFYRIGLFVKGFDGLLELVGGILLLTVSSGTILHLTKNLTHAELGEDPHDFWALHARQIGEQLAAGNHTFAAVFLLTHGVVKVGLVICLLLQKLWAYPLGILTLSALLLYQLYQLVVAPSTGIAVLSVFDALIIWLIWREWRIVRATKQRLP